MARELPCEVGDTITYFSFDKTGATITSDKVSKIVAHKDYFTIYTKKKFYPLRTSDYSFAPISEYPVAFAEYWIGEITIDEAKDRITAYRKTLGLQINKNSINTICRIAYNTLWCRLKTDTIYCALKRQGKNNLPYFGR